MTIYDEPKIDCHNHVFDPARFPYAADAYYLPSGQEVGTSAQLTSVFDAYGIRNAVVVGPNSGYGEDHNECLLDTIARSHGRFKGIAVVSNEIGRADLERFKAANIIGITFNVALLGVDHFINATDLLAELRDLNLFVDVQVEPDQLVAIAPRLRDSGVRMLVDHCGRPDVHAGLTQPGFQTLLSLAGTDRVHIKLSAHYKFSGEPYPYRDVWPVRARTDRHVRARWMRVGVRLAVPAGVRADGLWSAAHVGRSPVAPTRRNVAKCSGTPLDGSSDSIPNRDGLEYLCSSHASAAEGPSAPARALFQAGSSAAVTTSTPQNDEWRKESSKASPRRRASRSSPTMSRSSSVIGSYIGTCSVISASNLAKKK